MAYGDGPRLVRTLRTQEEEESPKRRPWGKLLVLLLVALAAAGIALYSHYTEQLLYTEYEVISRTEWSGTGSCLKGEGSVIYYTDNGAQAVDAEGNLLWNITYEMKDPILACCGKMTAIAERGGRQLYVTDEAGTVQKFTTLHTIQEIAVAAQGVTAVLMNAESEDYISLYNKSGELLYEICTVVESDGFPQTIALSKDGTKLVTSYLTPEGDSLVSRVTFYNFSGVGENYIRNMVGQVQYADTLVPRLAFLDNDTLCVFHETGFELFSMKEVPSSVKAVTFKEKIKSIAVGAKLAFVLENASGNDKNHLLVYDKEGKLCTDVTNSYSYDKIVAGEKEVILYSSLSCLILRMDGEVRFGYEFASNIRALFPAEKNRYFLVDDTGVQTIKLVRAKTEREEK